MIKNDKNIRLALFWGFDVVSFDFRVCLYKSVQLSLSPAH